MRGKSVNLFLMDGDASRRIKCGISNWTGVVYKIPRLDLDKCKERDDLKWSGIYLLFGEDDETGNPLVYVGQAGSRNNGEGILQRLIEHTRNEEKNYWSEVVILTTSNNTFGPTEISYLENRFCQMAKDAQRYQVQNKIIPNSGNITEEKESEMDEFVEQSSLLIQTLGYKVFDPISTKTVEEGGDGLRLFLERKSKKSGTTIKAQCVRSKGEFTVVEGSMIELIDSEQIHKTTKRERDNAVIENGILKKSVTFTNPSYAGGFVIGGVMNGQTEWKTKEGISLKEHDAIQLRE